MAIPNTLERVVGMTYVQVTSVLNGGYHEHVDRVAFDRLAPFRCINKISSKLEKLLILRSDEDSGHVYVARGEVPILITL